MSLYRKSWLFAAWTAVVALTLVYWITFLMELLGGAVLLVGIAIAAGHSLVAFFAFDCPECGLTIFQSRKGFWGTFSLWPNRKYGHCGRDHSLVD
ncbi:hypothetical protein H7Q97_05480 [Ochrobactrum sp. CM-21-5]|nr:hypothetical protein [Ochrobactrum sp. CM-21-5]MBC2884853.1 hypothetical protein [Ochrobactrum sp. CM-21-5]